MLEIIAKNSRELEDESVLHLLFGKTALNACVSHGMKPRPVLLKTHVSGALRGFKGTIGYF
jgi:hypothetical protein